MYYLLEDNRIIDSENYKDPYILSKDVIRNHEVLFLTSFKDQVSVKGTIKKQSENVFDLIEKGDLVKLDKTLNQVITILKEDKRTFFEIGDNKWFSFKELNNYLKNNLLAIYKPDESGNYIKAWEGKDDINK